MTETQRQALRHILDDEGLRGALLAFCQAQVDYWNNALIQELSKDGDAEIQPLVKKGNTIRVYSELVSIMDAATKKPLE